ncbi:hypothetical protein E5D57_006102 [Metarhizium anisopliae]|nr:hypothetical protein E5D57_006102 [Metarhizium anisopliae]
MSGITVTNNTAMEIYVSITATGGDAGKGGSEEWYTLHRDGGTTTWNYRKEWQVMRLTRSKSAGAPVETVLAIPGVPIAVN